MQLKRKFALLLTYGLILLPSFVQSSEADNSKSPDEIKTSIEYQWMERSPNLQELQMSSVSMVADEIPLTLFGTTTGSIYRADPDGGGWRQVKRMMIPKSFIRDLDKDDMTWLQKFGGLAEKEIENIVSLFVEEEADKQEIDISDIDYEDLSLDDIDLDAIDISDIEFRDTIDPDSFNIEDIEEEDIETIHITDETYLKNPQAVYARLAEDLEGKRKQKLDISIRDLERTLAAYKETFLSITQISTHSQNNAAFFALSPFVMYISRDRGWSWQSKLESRWNQGEYFIELTRRQDDPQRLLLLTSRELKYSDDQGETWQSLSGPTQEAVRKSIRFWGDRGQYYLILTSDALYKGSIDTTSTSLNPLEKINIGNLYTGDYTCFDVLGNRLILNCQQGLFLSQDGGREWQELKKTSLPFRNITRVLFITHQPSWILLLSDGVPYLSMDFGKSFLELALKRTGSLFHDLAVISDNEGGIIVSGITNRDVYYLHISKSGSAVSVSSLDKWQISAPHAPKTVIELPPYKHVLGQASRRCMWASSDFQRFSDRARWSGFFPRINVSFLYYDLDYNRYSVSQNITFQDNPDRYVIGPDEYTTYDYKYEYYTISCYLTWDLRQLVRSSMRNIARKKENSYNRMKRQEKKLRQLYADHKLIEHQLKTQDTDNVQSVLDLLIKATEIEALIFGHTGRYKNEIKH